MDVKISLKTVFSFLKFCEKNLQNLLLKSYYIVKPQYHILCSEHYAVSIENEELIWRRLGGKIKLRLATIQLTPISFNDALAEIIDFLLESSAANRSNMAELKLDCTKKSADLDNAIKMNKDLSKAQENSSKLLVEQFLPVLNRKKLRIQELEDELRKVQKRFVFNQIFF